MKALLLWYPSTDPNIEREIAYPSQEAILSDKFTAAEKERICDVLESVKSVPELLTY